MIGEVSEQTIRASPLCKVLHVAQYRYVWATPVPCPCVCAPAIGIPRRGETARRRRHARPVPAPWEARVTASQGAGERESRTLKVTRTLDSDSRVRDAGETADTRRSARPRSPAAGADPRRAPRSHARSVPPRYIIVTHPVVSRSKYGLYSMLKRPAPLPRSQPRATVARGRLGIPRNTNLKFWVLKGLCIYVRFRVSTDRLFENYRHGLFAALLSAFPAGESAQRARAAAAAARRRRRAPIEAPFTKVPSLHMRKVGLFSAAVADAGRRHAAQTNLQTVYEWRSSLPYSPASPIRI